MPRCFGIRIATIINQEPGGLTAFKSKEIIDETYTSTACKCDETATMVVCRRELYSLSRNLLERTNFPPRSKTSCWQVKIDT
jgi:hypothetical protein